MSLEIEKNIPYGFLNPLSENNSNKSDVDINTYSTFTAIQEIIKDKYTQNVFEGRIQFTAIVLKNIDELIGPTDFVSNVLETLFLQKNKLVRFIARIPELHAHLPIPEGPEDGNILSMYPVFEGPAELGKPQEGSLVKVTFDDISSQTNPRFIAQYSSEGGAAGNIYNKNESSGAKDAFVNSSPMTKAGNKSGGDLENYQFEGYKRQFPIDLIIIHESLDRTRAGTIRSLLGSKDGPLSVHYTIDRRGNTVQHLDDSLAAVHAEGHGVGGNINARSIGIEILNSATGKPIDGEIQKTGIEWMFDKKYILPTVSQMETCWNLIKSLCSKHSIPLQFPANTDKTKMHFSKWGGYQTAKGIMAHKRIAHSDGTFIENYCYLRNMGFTNGTAEGSAYAELLKICESPYKEKRIVPIPKYEKIQQQSSNIGSSVLDSIRPR